jgi:UDP-N-acetylmuramoyl-L-alanyl-D-glutamate--2,6-diaminopimelate ligase
MKLKDLLAGTGFIPPSESLEEEISSVAYDSRRVLPGSLFVAIRGGSVDGNRFVRDAIERGAVAVVSDAPQMGNISSIVPPVAMTGVAHSIAAGVGLGTGHTAAAHSVIRVRVPDARKSLAIIGANFYGHPAAKLGLVGITGTNGKTTTSYLVDSILHAAGHQTGLFGTIEYRTPLTARPAETTTPQSLDLQHFLAEIVAGHGKYAVLEASSHALALDRLWSCQFAAAVFTNLTRDHLDFHKTFEEYFAAKRRLFEGTGAGAPLVGVVNTDDEYGPRLTGLAQRTITYGLTSRAQVTTKKFSLSAVGLDFTADTPAGKLEIHSQLVGRINVYNLLAAIATCVALDVPRLSIEEGIAALIAVPGRFERIDLGQPFVVIVDYAHTDDALRNLLATARELDSNARIITLFGCGGERDRSKRPLMGEAAGRASDLVVLTSDNPRGEDPLLIINDALVGLQRTSAKVLVEPDRERAIEIAIERALPGDIVLIAGKGHESTQVLKARTIPFDDREVARRMLQQRGFGG